jgi:putative hydrolase of HD superfamily
MKIEKLSQQIGFITEIDKLKGILRQTSPIGMERRENSAEHSWQVVLCAITLQEHANQKIDLLKVVKMLALHDTVEIDVGDVFHYDKAATENLYEKELAAAKRIFSLLPEPQRTEYLELWTEFEAKETAEAKYATSIDRLIGVLMNTRNNGGAWVRHKINAKQVLEKNATIQEGSESLWEFAQSIVSECQSKGCIKPS